MESCVSNVLEIFYEEKFSYLRIFGRHKLFQYLFIHLAFKV